MNTSSKLGRLPNNLAPDVDDEETERQLALLNRLSLHLYCKMSELNDKDLLTWGAHTEANDVFSFVTDHVCKHFSAQLCTKAWCKFYEILCQFSLVPARAVPFHSFHLCEAPGAFVSALNHYIHAKDCKCSWTWRASTLNPYYEGNSMKTMVADDRLIIKTLDNWVFGRSSSGDICEPSFLEFLKSRHAGTCDLVTADGSIDCSGDPAEQELIVFPIIFAEVVCAITLLKEGGNLVLKKFTNFKNPTVGLIFVLTRLFKEVAFFKPRTSKGGNSECYVICLNFQGAPESCLDEFTNYYAAPHLDKSIWPIARIPTGFFEPLYQLSELLTNAQISAITANLDSFKAGKCPSKQAKQKTAKEWANKVKLKKLNKNDWLGDNIKIPWGANNYPPRRGTSYDERTGNTRQCFLQMFRSRLKDAEVERKRLEVFKYGILFSLPTLPPTFLVDALGACPCPEQCLDCGIRSSKFAPVELLDLYLAVLEDETLRREIEAANLRLESLEMVDLLKGKARAYTPCPLAKEVSTRLFLKEDWILLLQSMLHSRLDVVTLCIPHIILLMTRFSVAVMYLLCIIFESVEVQTFDAATRIVCSSRRVFGAESVDIVDEYLRGLMESLVACRPKTDYDILQPLPLTYFLEEEFYSTVLDQNFIVLLRIFDSLKQYVV